MQQNVFDEKLYTSTEVAEILGVSLRSIYRYLDENKLQAAVKTATGRHRFTRQNINDFLHPSGKSPQFGKIPPSVPASIGDEISEEGTPNMSEAPSADDIPQYSRREDVKGGEPEVLSRQKFVQSESEGGRISRERNKDEYVLQKAQEDVKDEPVDWLARFRQAAEKYKAQATKSEADSRADRPKSPKKDESTDSVREVGSFSKEETYDEGTFNYYRSGIGGLKEIAQSLDKSAKNASLDYAFTMNAGLSLHKPIKPFSLIHAYVRKGDLPYFERVLQLTPSQKDTAQLCLITSDDESLYSGRKELHGLYVVSDSRIKADLLAEGEVELASELE